jgi:hypothetical protein
MGFSHVRVGSPPDDAMTIIKAAAVPRARGFTAGRPVAFGTGSPTCAWVHLIRAQLAAHFRRLSHVRVGSPIRTPDTVLMIAAFPRARGFTVSGLQAAGTCRMMVAGPAAN